MKWDVNVCVLHSLTTCVHLPSHEEFERFRQIVPGIPDGIAITLGNNAKEYLTDSEYEALRKHAPWSFARKFAVQACYANTGFAADLYEWKLKPKARTSQAEWLRDALDRTVSLMAYAIRPSVLAKGRYARWPELRQSTYSAFRFLAARRFGFDPYGIKGEDIELQLIMWLKQFIDWHKEWVKAGRPLNLD